MIWTDHVRNKEVLCSVKEERSILHTAKRRKVGDFLHRNCTIVTERKIRGIKVIGGREKRCKQLLDDLKETGGN